MNITNQNRLLTKSLQIALGALLLAPIQSHAFLITNETGISRIFNSAANGQIIGRMHGELANGDSAGCDPMNTDCHNHRSIMTPTSDAACMAFAPMTPKLVTLRTGSPYTHTLSISTQVNSSHQKTSQPTSTQPIDTIMRTQPLTVVQS